MKGDGLNPSIIQEELSRLRQARQLLEAPELLNALRDITDEEAVELRGELIRILAILDDSVSNPLLGSIFQRSVADPLNRMADEIAADLTHVPRLDG